MKIYKVYAGEKSHIHTFAVYRHLSAVSKSHKSLTFIFFAEEILHTHHELSFRLVLIVPLL